MCRVEFSVQTNKRAGSNKSVQGGKIIYFLKTCMHVYYILQSRDEIRILIIRINSRIFKGMRIRIINLDIRIFHRQIICHYPLEIRFPTTTFPAKLEILYLSALS